MKKIAIASAAMGGAALIAFGASGTFAAFSDTENLRGEAGAATVDLTVGNTVLPASNLALNMVPGADTLYFPYFVKNTGDLKGYLGAQFDLTDYENSCSGDEFEAGDTCGAANDPGEFSRAATYDLYYTPGGTAAECTGTVANRIEYFADRSIPAGAPTSLTVPAELPLTSGSGLCIVVGITLPENVSNRVQGDSAALDVELRLEQIANQVDGAPAA